MRVASATEPGNSGGERGLDGDQNLIMAPDGTEADRYLLGSPEKGAALLRMKEAELATRNQPDGFWVAAASPTVVAEAIAGSVPLSQLRQLAVLTDGAARIVQAFDLLDWPGVVDLLGAAGPGALICRVRAIELADPLAVKWPRNKANDDATVAYAIPRRPI
jgi:hypothetical protein